ncbi:MAG: hypothetical protein VXW32_04355 [Myxococcota bacterium]|nr:hypothetical protein [Myxococcota bacterium]
MAYDAEMWQAFAQGHYWSGLTDFTGLHPPAWYLVHNLIEWLAPVPMLLIGLSLLCSIATVEFARRLGWMTGLLVATSPLQLAYAAELNNYPAFALCSAWLWWAHQRALNGLSSRALIVATVVGAWVHLLLAGVGLILASTVSRKLLLKTAGWLALFLLPLLPGIVELLTLGSAGNQPPFKPNLIFSQYVDRFGWLALVLLIPAWKGRKACRPLTVAFVALTLLILALQLARVAAPHQFPYWLALSLPFALLVQHGARTPQLRILVWFIAALQAIGVARLNMSQVSAINADLGQTRGIDVALQEAKPGDAIYLLRKRTLPDDDKRSYSPQLTRISPWRRLPRVRPYEFPYVDHRHGQPRDHRGTAIYVNDNPREVLQQAIEAHPNLFLVVSNPTRSRRFEQELLQWVSGPPEAVGPDLLYRLQPERR